MTTDYNGLPTSPHRIPTIRGATENIPINGNKRQSCWWYPVSKIGKSSWCKHLKIYILALALFHLVQDTPLWQKLCFWAKSYILRCFYFLASRLRRSARISPVLETAWESANFLSQFFVTNGGWKSSWNILQRYGLACAWESAHFSSQAHIFRHLYSPTPLCGQNPLLALVFLFIVTLPPPGPS